MRTKLITSSPNAAGFPRTDLPEVAFLGRSNVGKSSLLNALVAARIARTSRTPGRTQLINFFEVHSKSHDYVLADLPGFGYARAPEPVRASWKKLIRDYLSGREQLRAVLFLFDMRRGVEEEDVALFRELAASGKEILAVGTKSDKLAKGAVKPKLHELAGALGLPRESPIATSTTKQVGIDALRAKIEEIASQ